MTEPLSFETTWSTNIPEVAAQVSAALTQLKGQAAEIGLTMGQMDAQAEAAAAKVGTAFKGTATASESATTEMSAADKKAADNYTKWWEDALAKREAAERRMAEASVQAEKAAQQAAQQAAQSAQNAPAPDVTPGGAGDVGQTEEGLRSLIHTSEIAGIRMRDLRHVMTGAFVGVDVAIAAVDGKVDESTKKMLEFGKRVTEVGMAFAYGGPIGGAIAGLGVIVGLIVGQMQEAADKAKAMAADVAKPFDDLQKQIDQIAPSEDKLVSSIQATLGVSKEQAQAFKDAAASSTEFNDRLKELVSQEEKLAQVRSQAQQQRDIIANIHPTDMGDTASQYAYEQATAKIHQLDEAQHEAGYTAQWLAAQEGQQAVALQQVAVTATAAGDAYLKMDDAMAASQEGHDVSGEVIAAVNQQMSQSSDQLMEHLMNLSGTYSNPMQQWFHSMDAAFQQETQYVNDYNAGISSAEGILKNLASKALTPTSVTAGDMAATKAGTYTDQWDEYARRMKDVESLGAKSPWAKLVPGDVLAKGEEAIKAFAQAEEQAFYNGQRLNQIDMGSLKARVTSEINSIIGQYELLTKGEEAAAQALQDLAAKNPEQYKEFLKAENLAPDTTAAEAAKQTWGNVAKGLDAPTKAVANYSDVIKGLPKEVQTLLSAKTDKAKTDFEDFKTYLDDWIKHFGGVSVNVTASLETQQATVASQAAQGGQTGQIGPQPRAAGGPVMTGKPYWVGELGPELFVPPASGVIMNEAQIEAWAATNSTQLRSLYDKNPAFWNAVSSQHPGWNYTDWYDFLMNWMKGGEKFTSSAASKASGGVGGSASSGGGSGGGGGGGGGSGGGGGGGGSGSTLQNGTIIVKGSLTLMLDPGALVSVMDVHTHELIYSAQEATLQNANNLAAHGV
ncbi:MAG: hypothetical protein WCF84_02345 [Anaerolineae bacterium]